MLKLSPWNNCFFEDYGSVDRQSESTGSQPWGSKPANTKSHRKKPTGMMQRIDLSTNSLIHVETVETVVQLAVESAHIRSYRHCLCHWSFSLVHWVPGCQIELQLKTQVLQVPAHTLEFSQRHWYFLKRLSRCNRLHFIHLYSARLVRNTQRSCNSASKTPINANNVLEVNAGDLLQIRATCTFTGTCASFGNPTLATSWQYVTKPVL